MNKVDSTLKLLYNTDDTLVDRWPYFEIELRSARVYAMKITKIVESTSRLTQKTGPFDTTPSVQNLALQSYTYDP